MPNEKFKCTDPSPTMPSRKSLHCGSCRSHIDLLCFDERRECGSHSLTYHWHMAKALGAMQGSRGLILLLLEVTRVAQLFLRQDKLNSRALDVISLCL